MSVLIKEDNTNTVVQAKILRVLSLMIELYKRAYTPAQIATLLDVSERTAYRYLNLVESLGVEIDKDFNQKYFIAQDDCPFCHRAVKITMIDEA